MSTALERVLEIQARGNRAGMDFYIDQSNRAGEILWQIIKALNVKPISRITDEIAPDDTLLFGLYRASDVVAAAKSAALSAVNPGPVEPSNP